MFCPKCGCSIENGVKFCPECGENVAAAQTSPPPPPEPPKVQEPKPVWQETSKSQNINSPTQPQQSNPTSLDKPLSMWQYIGIMLLSALPIIGIVLIIMWAFNKSINTNKRNYARAVLVLFVLGLVLSIIISITFSSLLGAFFKFTISTPN